MSAVVVTIWLGTLNYYHEFPACDGLGYITMVGPVFDINGADGVDKAAMENEYSPIGCEPVLNGYSRYFGPAC